MVGERLARAAVCVAVVLLASAGAGACSAEHAGTIDLTGSRQVPTPPVTGVNTNFFVAPERLGDERVWEAVERAEFPTMRFPGGRGNRYDWRTGRASVDRTAEPGSVERSPGHLVPMDDFMSRAREEGASVSYVLNIEDSPEDIRDLARRWESTDAPVRWVEMGNEYYLPKLVDGIGGPEGYLDRARRALEALRAGGYEGPVGLVVEPSDPEDPESAWNKTMARLDTSDFDALVVHYYASLDGGGFESVYDEAPGRLAAIVEGLRGSFPGKRVWVTEWNLGRPPSAPEVNTLDHALFDLRMMKTLSELGVDLATYHVLTGRGWELLGPDRFALNYDDPKARLLERVPYFAFQMTSEAASGRARYVRGGEASAGVEHMAFRTRDELRVVAWTREKKGYDVEVELDGASTTFLGGRVLRGDLEDTNGSLLTMERDGETYEREVFPTQIDSARLEGPGAVLLRFSLE